jgi:hypothetical protein
MYCPVKCLMGLLKTIKCTFQRQGKKPHDVKHFIAISVTELSDSVYKAVQKFSFYYTLVL